MATKKKPKKYKGLSYRHKRMIRAVFEFQNFIFLLGTVLVLWVLIGFVSAEDYPDKNSLAYEECTFIKCEYIEYFYSKHGKRKYYNVYVEEYDKPLQTDDLVYKRINKNALAELKGGDSVKVSLSEEKDFFEIYSMSCDGVSILSYEDYLAEHERNNRVGAVVLPALLFMSIFGFVAGVKKTLKGY